MNASNLITFPNVIAASALSGIILAIGWFGSTVVEVDRTQEGVLQKLESIKGRCDDRGAQVAALRGELETHINSLRQELDQRAADRFYGKDAEALRERLEAEHGKIDQHIMFIWQELNRQNEVIIKLHDALREHDREIFTNRKGVTP